MSILTRHRTAVLWGLLIFGVAFALRLVFILWAQFDVDEIHDDSWLYDAIGRGLAAGEGFSIEGSGAPNAGRPPVFALLLGAVYRLPGDDLIAGRVLNVTAGAATCVLVFATVMLLWDGRAGIAAGLALAFFPSHVFASVMVLPEVVFGALLALAALIFAWSLRGKPNGSALLPAVATGVVLGLATLTQGFSILLPVAFAIVWWVSTRSLRSAARFGGIVIAISVLMLSAWAIRNAIEVGYPAPTSTGSATALAVAHWDGADGTWQPERLGSFKGLYSDVPPDEREAKLARKQLGDAVEYAAAHPGHELTLIPRRLRTLFQHDHAVLDMIRRYDIDPSGRAMARLGIVADAYYAALLFAALAGAMRWWRRRPEGATVPLAIVITISATIALTFVGDERYHAPLLPFVVLLAAPALLAARDAVAGSAVLPRLGRPVLARAAAVVPLLLVAGIVSFFVVRPPGVSSEACDTISRGPRLGAVTQSTVKVWVRLCRPGEFAVQYKAQDADWLRAIERTAAATEDLDNTRVVTLEGLAPETRYDYRIGVKGEAFAPASFWTPPPPETPSRLTFIMSSDLHRPAFTLDKPMATMASHEPAFALFVGDSILVNDGYVDTRGEYEATYRESWDDAGFDMFSARFPTIMMWDDHEIRNDWDRKTSGPYPAARAAYDEYIGALNPPAQDRGVYYTYSAGGAEFFVLDTRTYRSFNRSPDGPEKTMLGGQQKADLKEWLLTSNAPFKFIVSSVWWNDASGHVVVGESWPAFRTERTEIFDFIRDNNVSGVMLLSGDEHVTGVFRFEPWGLVEMAPGPVSWNLRKRNEDNPQVEFMLAGARVFGLFTVDTTVCPATLEARIVDEHDKVHYTLETTEAELSGGGPIACPAP